MGSVSSMGSRLKRGDRSTHRWLQESQRPPPAGRAPLHQGAECLTRPRGVRDPLKDVSPHTEQGQGLPDLSLLALSCWKSTTQETPSPPAPQSFSSL